MACPLNPYRENGSFSTSYSLVDPLFIVVRLQLLHGMESTTSAMLAQFAAGLVHFADYKRCKVIGDLLGVDDVTKPPPHDHRAALFLYRFLAELRTVRVRA